MDALSPITQPFGKDVCAYFYYLMIFAIISVIISVFGLIKVAVSDAKNFDMGDLFLPVSSLLSSFLMYFTNRVFYSMCIKSLN
jgi:hypothetical protein